MLGGSLSASAKPKSANRTGVSQKSVKKKKAKRLKLANLGLQSRLSIVCPKYVRVKAGKQRPGFIRPAFKAKFYRIEHTKKQANHEGHYQCMYRFEGQKTAPVPYYRTKQLYPRGGWGNLPCSISGRTLTCSEPTNLDVPSQKMEVPTLPKR